MERMSKLVLALLIIGTFLFVTPARSDAETYEIAKYFPSVVTDSWTYINGVLTDTATITGTRVIGSITTLKYTSGDGSEEYYTVDSNGLRNHGVYFYNASMGGWIFQSYNTPLLITPANVSAGSTYNGNSSFTFYGYTFNLYSTVVINGLEDVVTQSGVVLENSIKMTWTLTTECPALGYSDSVTQVRWLYKDMGVVKMYVPSTGETGTIKNGITHYASSRKKAQLLASADASGNIYYVYMDENFNGQGYGRVYKSQKADGTFVVTEYWGSTNKKHYAFFVGLDDVWQKTIEYQEDGVTLHQQWIADAHTGVLGDEIYYCYDSQGRMTHKIFDTGDLIAFDYWSTTSAKHCEYYFSASGVWQKTIEYCEDGVTMNQQWIADANPSTPGDDVYYHYDSQGRLTHKVSDEGESIVTEYRGTTEVKLYDYFFDKSGNWQKTIEYYEDGVTMHRQWMSDADLGQTGDIVYEEYDEAGTCVFRVFDDGSMEDPSAPESEAAERLALQAGLNKPQGGEGIGFSPQMAGAPSSVGMLNK